MGREVDGRSDIFSLGAVIYEMATGNRPFGGENAAEITDRILHSQPAAIARFNYEVPEEFDRIVRKCLEKDRERRYQSARDLRVDLGNMKRDLEYGSGEAALRTPAEATARAPAQPFRWRRAAIGASLLLLSAGTYGVLRLGPWRPVDAKSLSSIAVLPLANMTGDSTQEYFADGMTEALITELARIRSLKVIARTSSMRFKKSDKALPEIARQLGVEGIVEGSVMRGGGRVRVTAHLIRASTQEHLWGDNFDRQEEDVLALDSEIAQTIAAQVHTALGPEDAGRLPQRRKVKPEAYDLVLQGFSLIKSGGDPDAFRRAIALFEKAVTLDPQSVEAHAGLANALQTLAGWGFAPYWDYYPRIQKEVETAMALDPNYSWAHLAKGGLQWAERNPRGALASRRRAVELDPADSTALAEYSGLLLMLEPGGEGEALMRKAIEMDPLAQPPRCNYKDWPDFDTIREDPRFQRVVEDRKLPVASFCRIPQNEPKR